MEIALVHDQMGHMQMMHRIAESHEVQIERIVKGMLITELHEYLHLLYLNFIKTNDSPHALTTQQLT